MARTDRQEAFLEVSGVKVHVLEGGAGPPVLYLHGAGSPGLWNDWHDAISAEHRLIAPSHPGFGDSDRPDWLLGIDDMVFFYLELLDHLKLDRVSLVGSSVGGWIAAELATMEPRRVEKLVLACAAGLYSPELPMADMFFTAPAELRSLLYYDPSAIPVPEMTHDLMRRQYKGQVTMARIAWNPYLHNPKLARRLARINAPTLIVWGDSDRLIPPGYAELYRSRIQNSRVSIIERCGHNILVERPKEFASVAAGFLQEKRGGNR